MTIVFIDRIVNVNCGCPLSADRLIDTKKENEPV